MDSTTHQIKIHGIVIIQLQTEVTKVNRGVLLTLENPGYKDMVAQYQHLKGAFMDDVDLKRDLPVYLILGTNEYARIKTETTPKTGKPVEPIAEMTRLGWRIMLPGSDPELTNMLLMQTSATYFEALCRLDVLGLQDHPVGNQDLVYEEEQLTRNPEGWHETGLLWKGNHPPLPNNKHGSLKRLQQQPDMLRKYDAIIQDR